MCCCRLTGRAGASNRWWDSRSSRGHSARRGCDAVVATGVTPAMKPYYEYIYHVQTVRLLSCELDELPNAYASCGDLASTDVPRECRDVRKVARRNGQGVIGRRAPAIAVERTVEASRTSILEPVTRTVRKSLTKRSRCEFERRLAKVAVCPNASRVANRGLRHRERQDVREAVGTGGIEATEVVEVGVVARCHPVAAAALRH